MSSMIAHFFCLLGAAAIGFLTAWFYRWFDIQDLKKRLKTTPRVMLQPSDFSPVIQRINHQEEKIEQLMARLSAKMTPSSPTVVTHTDEKLTKRVDTLAETVRRIEPLTNDVLTKEVQIQKLLERPQPQVNIPITDLSPIIKRVELLTESVNSLSKVVAANSIKLKQDPQPRKVIKDDLKRVYGVGPVLEKFLNKQGVSQFRQIAKWDKKTIEKFEALLPNFSGRIERENWVRSAQEEHYKKYKRWLGKGQPSITLPETN